MSRLEKSRELGVVLSRRGEDFVLRRFDAEEELSRPFRFVAELASEDTEVDLEEMIGETLGAWLLVRGGELRWFHGRITRFVFLGVRGRYARYQAVVEPWVALLDRNRDCRIFQEATVPEIVREVLRERGITDFEFRLTDTYPRREYCVQYRESDFAFLSRLLEEEGISYWFDHRKDRHIIVFGDASTAHVPVPGYEQVGYLPPTGNRVDEDRIEDWTLQTDLRPATCQLKDFDFAAPGKDLVARKTPAEKLGPSGKGLLVYDWPGDYIEPDDGQRYARIRIEEIHAQRETGQGAGDVRGLRPGHVFGLSSYPRRDQNRDWLVIRTDTRLVSDAFESEAPGAPREPICRAEFRAIDRRRPFRPARKTPRPVIRGPQTAIVTGPAGEEIWTDRHGRVKVLFHWDRHGTADEKSSCFIRVSQPWAGNGWGGLAIPRIGQEVVVEFLEGDPDRPLINGRVYNGAQKPPQDLPAARANMSIRSQSYPGGGGSNEITMNDTKGEEGFLIHAQYDHTISVGNNRTEEVGVDESVKIGNNRTSEIGVDSSEKIGSNLTVEIGANASEKVGTNKVVDVGSNLTLTAGTSITLKCGASTIHMNQAGVITISGMLVTMAATVNANVAAPITTVTGAALSTNTGAINLVSGGALAHVWSGGTTTIKGGKVKIN